MRKQFFVYGLAVLVVALAFAYIRIGPPPEAPVRLVTPPAIIASLPVWIAEQEGFFDKRNLKIEFIDLTNSKYMVETLLAGNADVLPAVSLVDLATTGGPGKFALLHSRIFSHARMKKNPPFEAILVGAGSTLNTLSDLADNSIAVYPGMTSELAVRHFLTEAGVDVMKVKFVKLPPPEHERALLRGDVQAIHVYEPFRSLSLSNGKARELFGSVYASLNEPSAIGVSAISRDFERANPVAAAQFLAAWDDAVRFIRDHPQDARKILAEKLGLPDEIAEKATWVDVTTVAETSYDTLKQTTISAVAAGIIPEGFVFERDMVYQE
ncbi:MAG TPA: hypothetical protein ENJ84_01415 [Gammaproteobacteria bacterium]|nr:hypothetical protein [Gammaproteobacteria bacterium]